MDNIAIVGMGCLFPDYSDKEKFWNKLINGERFTYQYDYQGLAVDRSGLVGPGEEFFKGRLPDAEIHELDEYGDLFKWVAYVTDEALKQSGYAGDSERLQRTGMVFGCLAQPIKDQFDAMYDYIEPTVNKELSWVLGDDRFAYHRDHRDLKIQSMFTDTEPVRYIAQKRGFGGPAVMFSAACATPLYAMKLAAMYLNAGEADMIIAGSHCSNESDEAACGLFDTFGILCETGESRPLNKHSNGIVTGSGAGAFALKRLADAKRDGDEILAVIESIGLSNDGGSGSGILSPSKQGQLVSYGTAYAGGCSHDIDYIECHATGTEAGDESEVGSIEEFFNADRAEKVLIGALKGNTGHFLTATGCASIAKVIMALQHGVIPSTIGVDDPIYDSVVRKNTPWEPKTKGAPRRAGINAFGFGGVNAHLVLREDVAEVPREEDVAGASHEHVTEVSHEETLAIIGMGLNIGNFRSVEDFLEGLKHSTTAFEAPGHARLRNYSSDQEYMDSIGLGEVPKGSYINTFDFDTMRFKMPVNSDTFFLRRDMLLLETAAEALDEAGVKEGAAPRTAVIINSALDFSDEIFYATSDLKPSVIASLKHTCPEMTDAQIDEIVRIVRKDEKSRETPDTAPGSITSIRGNRISSHWGFSGPSFTVFEQEVSIFRCLELAKFFINEGLADQAVIGAVSFAGEIEHLYAEKELGVLDLMCDKGIAEGAVVLVLKPMNAARAAGDRIYAAVDGVALSGVSPDGARNMETTLDKALGQAKVDANEIGVIEVPDSYDNQYGAMIGDPDVVRMTRRSQGMVTQKSVRRMTQNVESYLGFGFSLSAAASIVRQALQLYLSCSFDFGKQPVWWDQRSGKRVSLVTGYTYEKQFGCAVLSAVTPDVIPPQSPGSRSQPPVSQSQPPVIPSRPPVNQSRTPAILPQAGSQEPNRLTSRLVMVPIRFGTPDDLRQKLIDLDSQAASSTFRKIYESMWAEFSRTNLASNTAVLLCFSKESLHDEVKQLIRAVPEFSDPGFVYASDRGSYCTLTDPGSPKFVVDPRVILPSAGSAKLVDDSRVILPSAGSPVPDDPVMDDFAAWFGLPPDAGVDRTMALYWPKNHLLRLGAQLLSHNVPFDLEKFLSRFDFYPLNRPSHVVQICNGLPAMHEHLSNPENRVRIALKGSESIAQLETSGTWEMDLAIVGMGFHVGAFDSLGAFLNGLMTSNKAFGAPQGNDDLTSADTLLNETLAMALADSRLSKDEIRDAAFVRVIPDSPEKVRIEGTDQQTVGGPCYTMHGGDIVFFQGLTLAHDIITQRLASTVCVATAPVAEDSGSEGAVVIVLRGKDRALEEHDKIYACVSAVTMEESSGTTALSSVLDIASVGRHELRVADVSGPEFDQDFNRFDDYLDTRFATTDVDRWLGRHLQISAAASLVKHALQLSFFTVFAFDPGTSGPSINDQLAQTFWGDAARRSSLIAYSSTGGNGFAVLTECIDTMDTATPYPSDLALLPISCSAPDDLRGKLTSLQNSSMGMKPLWEAAWRNYRSRTAAYTAVLAFSSRSSLDEEISAMLASLDRLSDGNHFIPGGKYESTLGSYFTADPYGEDAQIVYMNPPYTLHYFLLFYQLIMMFPQYRSDYLDYLNSSYQQMLNGLDFHFGFSGIESGMIWVARKLAREVFGLSPDILIGASLGEITSLVAYRSVNWNNAKPDAVYRLFTAFRDVFTFSTKDMTPMYCKGPLDDIKKIAAEHGDVFVSLIASPDGAFIAGTQEAVDSVVKEGGFLAWRLANDLAIHTPLVEHFYDEVYDAARDSGLRLRSDRDFDIYSTYLKRPISDSQEDFCEYAATILIKECDFYGLLEVLYDKGGRIFIDMGTGGSCSDWARDTFRGRNTTVFSIYPPVLDPIGQLFRTFAQLISNRVHFDCSVLVDNFTYPFMEAEELVRPDSQAAPQPELSAFVSRALANNVSAYTTYVDNEMLLLDWLGRKHTTDKRTSHVIWDREQILEITGGSPSKVWGKRYEVLDSLAVRARMPMPPFLFVDRVVGIDAEFGELRPSWIETETDINDDCIMLTSENMITPTLLAESSHSAILLLSYMGIDVISGGGLGYRILNTRGEYHDDIPLRGDTVHSRLEFTDFINSGSMTLVTSKFWCYDSHDRLIVTFDLLGGLFTEQDLATGNSASQPAIPPFTPLDEPYSNDSLYDGSQGPLFYPLPTSPVAEPVFVNPKIQMVDRIIGFDLTGGDYGLGLIVAEKDIDESHWAFKVHFLNDPVFPGTLLSEASSQIQFMYAMTAGYMKADRKYYLLNNRNVVLNSSFRGEVKPVKSVVTYVQQFKEVKQTDKKVVILSDLDVYWQGRHVSRTENCCLDIEEIIR